MPKDTATRALREFALLKALAATETLPEVEALFAEVTGLRPRRRARLFAESLRRRRHGVEDLLRTVQGHRKEDADVITHAISGRVGAGEFDLMLATYEEWNKVEDETAPAVQMKATALAGAISRCMNKSLLLRLRGTVTRMQLAGADSSRPIILSLLKFGNKRDVQLVLDRIANERFPIYFRNHTELGRTLMKRMAEVESSVPMFVSTIVGKREFWEYFPAEERAKAQPGDLLSIKDVSNRSLYYSHACLTAVSRKWKNAPPRSARSFM
jgi:hypothetical protein